MGKYQWRVWGVLGFKAQGLVVKVVRAVWRGVRLRKSSHHGASEVGTISTTRFWLPPGQGSSEEGEMCDRLNSVLSKRSTEASMASATEGGSAPGTIVYPLR